MPLLSGLLWAFFVISTGLSGCAASAAHTTSPQEIAVDASPAVSAAPTLVEATQPEQDEHSVHPGINDPYFRPGRLVTRESSKQKAAKSSNVARTSLTRLAFVREW